MKTFEKITGLKTVKRADGKYWIASKNGRIYPFITGIICYLVANIFIVAAIFTAILITGECRNAENISDLLIFFAEKIPLAIVTYVFGKIGLSILNKWVDIK